MRSLTAFSGVLAGLLALAACAEPAVHGEFAAPWVPFVDGDGMAGAYDSATVRFRGDTAELWLRFRLAAPKPMPNDSTRSYSVIEAAELVHCPSERVQDVRSKLGGENADSLAGYTNETHVWQTFEEHPMSPRIFVRLCRALADRVRRAGA